ncbi:MAG: pantetheine-phosphate adenylyltransferase [bacterium]|nr:pantetheine-phosphate adenylyltransferase [bacterium]
MKRTIAIYPGSFDPPTLGHINVVERGLTVFKKIIIAVALNTSKECLFTPEERVTLLKTIYKGKPNVEVDFFNGLLVEYAQKKKANVILRGLRTVNDYEYELQMAFSNKSINPDIETMFLMTENQYSHISSTLIKEIAHFGGPIKKMVPPAVEKAIKAKMKERRK